MANTSFLFAFERFWQHVLAKIGDKADVEHNHDGTYCKIIPVNSANTKLFSATLNTKKQPYPNGCNRNNSVIIGFEYTLGEISGNVIWSNGSHPNLNGNISITINYDSDGWYVSATNIANGSSFTDESNYMYKAIFTQF